MHYEGSVLVFILLGENAKSKMANRPINYPRNMTFNRSVVCIQIHGSGIAQIAKMDNIDGQNPWSLEIKSINNRGISQE